MYVVSKSALSKYVTGGCRRRFRLDLYSAKGRKAAGAVDKDPMRAGSQYLKEQGKDHERKLYKELIRIFGSAKVLRGDQKPFEEAEETALKEVRLADFAANLKTGDLVLEGQYEVTPTFVSAHGIDQTMRMGLNRPDIIHVTAPAANRRAVTPGGDIVPLDDNDTRPGLRIIDIKLASDPGPSHFAELAYYSMTLAGWLKDHGLADSFVVTDNAAIWPGKNDGSALLDYAKPGEYTTPTGILAAWEKDLESMPAAVMLPRLVRAIRIDLPETVAVPDWNSLPVHVGERCAGCDYLGFPWRPDDDSEIAQVDGHCWPLSARTDNLSRVTGMTEGAAGTLQAAGIADVRSLAALNPDDPLFDRHQTLNTQRHVFVARAKALRDKTSGIADDVGSSASIPRFSDIRVSLSVEFDAASGDAFALGWETVAAIPVAKGVSEKPEWKGTYVREAERDGNVVLVRKQDLETQMVTFHRFLSDIQAKVTELAERIEQAYLDLGDKKRAPTIQFYIWDQATFEQFRRMMGRYLPYLQRNDIRHGNDYEKRMKPVMGWMFAPDNVLADADHVSPGSPVTVVRHAIRLLALQLPHFYGQMQVANAYRHVRPGANLDPYEYRLNYDFNDPLTDRIPSERGHEIWHGKHPKRYEDKEAFETKLKAAIRMRNQSTLSIARKLAHDLNDKLFAPAPTVKSVFGTGKPLFGVAADLQAIYQHARLMEAAAANDMSVSMAMTPFEREARFAAVVIVGQLHGAERASALASSGIEDDDTAIHVFNVWPTSKDAKIKAGDRGVSVMPGQMMDQRDRRLSKIIEEHPDVRRYLRARDEKEEDRDKRTTLREACMAEVLAFDRQNLLIVLRGGEMLEALVKANVFDMEFEMDYPGVIDGLHRDFFIRRLLEPILRSIAAPPKSALNRLISPGILRMSNSPPKTTPSVPIEDFLWDAGKLHLTKSGRDMTSAWEGIDRYRQAPTSSQREAIDASLSRRLSLLWGPPGTGKSATSKSIFTGLLSAARHGRPVRIALTGPTWVSIDNVMADLPSMLEKMGLSADVTLARLKSSDGTLNGVPGKLHPYVVETEASHDRMPNLVSNLVDSERITIVAGTSNQLANLGNICEAQRGTRELFDFMLVDEASQMDVAHAIVAFSVLATGASVTIVGDDLQMSPIHPVESPEDFDFVFGSIYDFYARYRGATPETSNIQRVMLNENFRSNREIVNFFAEAGYPHLSASPRNAGHRAEMTPPIPSKRPGDWPETLPWSNKYATILDPSAPLVAIIHDDRFASQRNESEASFVAGMVEVLRGRLHPIEPKEGRAHGRPMNDADFFSEGIGVVTPHRAQQAAVIAAIRGSDRLGKDAISAMEASVDTVERFQGQQRVVMIASFGMGDLDQIGGEEEFLYNLNRFNVIVSRAQAKMVVIMSRRMADYLPRDLDTLRGSSLLKSYVDGNHMRNRETMELGQLGQCEVRF